VVARGPTGSGKTTTLNSALAPQRTRWSSTSPDPRLPHERDCRQGGAHGPPGALDAAGGDELKELVISGALASKLKQEAVRLGMSSLRMSALAKMMDGVTTLEEVVANTAPDHF
jgi:type II secretory ATPase GspE/PulE/Tfp pilus assembly ATPase PilB-like protein